MDEHKDELQPGRIRRGCLKSPGHSKPPSPDPASPPPLVGSLDGCSRPCNASRKSVSFCSEDAYDVWDADEWDRTPSEPARNLSYQDMLELKAIQRTLPRANQLPDMYTGRPGSHFLGKVPIGLLPLAVSDEERQYPPTNTPPSTPSPVQSGYSTPRKNFSFIPLLESEPVPSHAARLKAVASPMLAPPSPLVLNPNVTSATTTDVLSAVKPIARKRNVMYINGEEVDLDEDEPSPVEEKKPEVDPLMIACSFRAKRHTPTPPSPPPIPTPPAVVTAQPKITTPEPPDPITLPACSFRARRVSPPPVAATRLPPTLVSPPSPRPTSPPSTIRSPVSPISRAANPTTVRRVPWDSSMTVRTTRDNTNPSGMVGLGGHGWQSGRTSPVLRA